MRANGSLQLSGGEGPVFEDPMGTAYFLPFIFSVPPFFSELKQSGK